MLARNCEHFLLKTFKKVHKVIDKIYNKDII